MDNVEVLYFTLAEVLYVTFWMTVFLYVTLWYSYMDILRMSIYDACLVLYDLTY